MRHLIALLIAVLLPVTTLMAGCNADSLNDWLVHHGRQPLVEPELSRAVSLVTAIEQEVDRRKNFVGEIAVVDEARLGLSWRPGCPVAPADLRLLTLSFWGMDNVGHVGELIVHQRIASKTLAVFRTLWNDKFPINRMETAEKFASPSDFTPTGQFIERHDAPDTVNDTSSFFCRPATGGGSWSQHALGLAIDINPVQNPYVKGALVIPINGTRDAALPGTILAGGVVVKAMTRAGLKWGGAWRSLKDYMHFSASGR